MGEQVDFLQPVVTSVQFYRARVQGAAPRITEELRTVSLQLDGSVALSALVEGTAPLVYRWLHDGQPLLNSPAAPALSIPAASAADAGQYVLTVSNRFGLAQGQPFSVAITGERPVIANQPQDACLGKSFSARFPVRSSGTPAPTFQWFHNSQSLPAGTNSTLSLTSPSTADLGDYFVVVSNVVGSVTSNKSRSQVGAGILPGGEARMRRISW